MKAPINSSKHIVQTTLTSVAINTVLNIDLARVEANAALDPGTATEIGQGTIIKAVFLEYWLLGDGQQPTTMTAMIEKTVNNSNGITTGAAAILHTYINKKNLFEIHQGIIGDANSNPIPIFRGWVKIPKGKQRFGIGDGLVFSIRGITETTNVCGFAIYKAYN